MLSASATVAVRATPPITGATTCANSSCHGGADEKSRQFVFWSQHDIHSRSYATLTTARSARMAEALNIPDPTKSARCTTCHAPAQTVAPALLALDAHVAEGVSCVTCHGPATEWLRTHTRLDLTHGERVAAGMRELRSLHDRANACVACHQNVEAALVRTGHHPMLRFELDGMTQSQPKHWREPEGRSGAQAWFVGQAVALRETSWALTNSVTDAELETPRWQALIWLVRHTAPAATTTALEKLSAETTPANFNTGQQLADSIARAASDTWSAADTRQALDRLLGTAGEFRDSQTPALVQACRAERLVLALDRLLAALPAPDRPPTASAQLDRLFPLVQSQPDFAPAEFARELAGLAKIFGK